MNHRELLDYYERELIYLRQTSQDFAKRHPGAARQLEMQPDGSADPHVERLMEAFAFLTARLHRRLDDDIPEISQAMINLMNPALIAPIPSLSILRMVPDISQSSAEAGTFVPRHSNVTFLNRSELPICFRTCYDTRLWPINVTEVELKSQTPAYGSAAQCESLLSLTLEREANGKLSQLPINELRFFLNGANRQVSSLYEYLTQQISQIQLMDPDRDNSVIGILSARDCIRLVGFSPEETLIPQDGRLNHGTRLLIEYFAFPQKFHFIELHGLQSILPLVSGNRVRIQFLSPQRYSGSYEAVGNNSLLLGCTPIVNLFSKLAERIHVSHRESDYRVIPDRFLNKSLEVYSVESVSSIERSGPGNLARTEEYLPFCGASWNARGSSASRYWISHRRPTHRTLGDGTDVHLSLVNRELDLETPAASIFLVKTLCFNRSLHNGRPLGELEGDVIIEGIPIRSDRSGCVVRPTEVIRRSLNKGLIWKLISNTSVNHSCLADPHTGLRSLHELLSLYNFNQSEQNVRQIEGIDAIQCRPTMTRVRTSDGNHAACRGYDIQLQFNDDHFHGSSPLLFSEVISQLLLSQISINSFCRITANIPSKQGAIKQWNPQQGRLHRL